MENHMKDIANLFGLELGEKFKLFYDNGDEREGEYIITEYGLKRTESGLYDCTDILMCMLQGCYEIKKLPWKPQDGEVYYFPDVSLGRPHADEDEWGDDARDNVRYEANMVCKTEKEAREKSKKMLKALKEEEHENE